MMKGVFKLTLGVLLMALAINYCYNNFFLARQITGTYLVKEFKGRPFLPEIPYSRDTLVIYENGRFKSGFFGEGTYVMSYSISGTKIELTHNYEFGKASLSRSIERFNLRTLKIVLDEANEHFYEKL